MPGCRGGVWLDPLLGCSPGCDINIAGCMPPTMSVTCSNIVNRICLRNSKIMIFYCFNRCIQSTEYQLYIINMI